MPPILREEPPTSNEVDEEEEDVANDDENIEDEGTVSDFEESEGKHDNKSRDLGYKCIHQFNLD